MRYAIISVYDKTGIDELARFMNEAGYTIIATGNTYNYLKKIRLAGLRKIGEITGFSEILGGRVKTLHPAIFGGILALRDNNDHIKDLENNHINFIDIVAVNLYPFEEMKQKNISFEEKLEFIDIGGVSLLRAAAKNFKYVTVLSNPEQYSGIIPFLKSGQEVPEGFKKNLSTHVFRLTSEYDRDICAFLSEKGEIINNNNNNNNNKHKDSDLKNRLDIRLHKIDDLRYGENPHQKASFYASYVSEASPEKANYRGFEKLSGKEISYNNLLDIDSAIDFIRDFYADEDGYFSFIIKHTNPCGAALSALNLKDAFIKARKADEISSFGGIAGFNRTVDPVTAKELKPLFLEIIIAPDYDPLALEILKTKKNTIIIRLDKGLISKEGIYYYRSAAGGMLVQEKDYKKDDVSAFRVVTRKTPNEAEWSDLVFAWKVAKHVKSNAVIYAKDGVTFGIGAGQMSRIDSAKFAFEKMLGAYGEGKNGFVMASDGFFPFKDSVEYAKKIGVSAIIEPGGSMRDNEVVEEAEKSNIALIFTGIRHFRH